MWSNNPHLPHGFDSFLKQVEITVTSQITRSDHVTIKTPELLHLQTQGSCWTVNHVIMWSTVRQSNSSPTVHVFESSVCESE